MPRFPHVLLPVLVLATVLLGIALGSAIASLRVRRSRDPMRALAWIQIWTGVLVIASMTLLALTYRIRWRTSGMIQACIVAILPATTLMGAAFPFAVASWLGTAPSRVGRSVGVLYATNVCGAVAGSLAGGFAHPRKFGRKSNQKRGLSHLKKRIGVWRRLVLNVLKLKVFMSIKLVY